MSLTVNFKNIYTSYPQLSVEELEDSLQRIKEDLTLLNQRSERFDCECKAFVVPVDTHEYTDGRFNVKLCNYPLNELCDSCSTSLHSLIGAGKSDAQHLHPRLYAFIQYHYMDLLEFAMYAKKRNFVELTNEELYQKIDDSYEYSRYLRRAESRFDWQEEPTPPGLREQVYTTDKDMEALEFERKARITRGTLLSS